MFTMFTRHTVNTCRGFGALQAAQKRNKRGSIVNPYITRTFKKLGCAFEVYSRCVCLVKSVSLAFIIS